MNTTTAIATEQAPGFYRRRVGEVLVTALNDGALTIPFEMFQNIAPDAVTPILHAAGRRPPFSSAINAYLLQWPGHTVLIDAGAGSLMGPGGGRLLHNLAAAGVSADEVTTLLLTHMHIDHVGAMLDEAGAPVFPNAELAVAGIELDFWHDDAAKAAAPEARRSSFDLARRVTAPYAARLRRLADGTALPNVAAVPLPGHTPGHTGFMLASGGERLLVWGDIAHLPALQAARPDVTILFDSDPAQAAATRRRIMAQAADEDLLVAGMHMDFPGLCRIARAGDGFMVQPEAWRGLPA